MLRGHDWIGLVGIALVAGGCYLLHPALALIIPGAFCVLYAVARGRQAREEQAR